MLNTSKWFISSVEPATPRRAIARATEKLAIAWIVGTALLAFGCAADAGPAAPKPGPGSSGSGTGGTGGTGGDPISVAAYCANADYCGALGNYTYDSCQTEI